MNKVMGSLIILLALVIAIVPAFTDCLSQGRALTTQDGKTVPMKCHWTGVAELGVAIPLGLIGIFSFRKQRKDTTRSLAAVGAACGLLAVLFPTALIGTCAMPTMICNLIMKPTLIASGILIIAASIVLFVNAREPENPGCRDSRMNWLQLAWKNISGNTYRSWVVAICALLVAAFAMFATILLRGAATSLKLASDRLGADIIVVPEGAEADMEGALLMGVPAEFWMPESNIAALAAMPDVEAISPQVYLATLTGASCCSVSNMFMVAYDPQTDFAVRPWLKGELIEGLDLGEVVGGSYISATEGKQNIRVYGYLVTLKANIEPTGTGLDQTMFFTLQTARDIARISQAMAERPLDIPQDQVSAILLKVKPGSDPHKVAIEIYRNVPGVVPIESSNLFQASRKQLNSLLHTMLILLGATWLLSVVLIGLVFSMAANERRRELGVLRALGATRRFIGQSLLTEAGILALCGGAVGIFLAVLVIYLFRQLIMVSLGIPFLLPSPGLLAIQIGAGLLLALFSVFLAALFPALKISRQDPAIAMRE